MRSARFLLLSAIIYASFSAELGLAQAVAPSIQIVDSINESKLVTLKGNTHPFANAKNDRGRVSPDLAMTDLIMVLSRSPQQQAAFDKFVASQYDPGSSNFHRWLNPDEVGLDFGPAPADLATISAWLSGQGFSINEVTRDRMSIRFGGTAAQVESAFHTEIHNLEVKGVRHIGNMTDPRIPAALAPAVVGVKSLHNFFPRPLHRTGSQVTKDAATGKWQRTADSTTDSTQNPTARRASPRPQFGVNVPASGSTSAYLVEDVSPYDFAAIYNVLPLWTASSPIDGTGQTIAVAGTSDICLGQTDPNCADTSGGYNNDVSTFRTAFGLPAYTSANQPTAVSGNSQPLTVCTTTDTTQLCNIDDLIENSLDVEWSGSVAKGAKIVLVASYPSSASDDNVYDSASYIVNNKTASIMSLSYGLCELFNGTTNNVEYYDLWQTASTEGIAVFVASGDGGAAACDDGGDASGNPYSAQYGLSVNGLASTPYNTAVGGTDFNWCSLASTTECTAAPYWNTSNATNGSSAKGYVPEVPWNDTCTSPLALGYLEAQAATLSVGGVTDAESACNFADNNSSSGSLAYLVDTVGGGGGASGCVLNDGNDVSSCLTSTTNTTSTNGSIPLFNDGWPKPGWQTGVAGIPGDGVRDLPDISFFASDGFLSSSAYLICVSNVAACTYTTSTEPTAQEVGGTSVATPAMAGVMALINQKAGVAQGSPNAELYKLAATQTYASCSAEKATTGNSCLFNDIDTGTIAMPCDYGAEEGNPAQTGIQSPNCAVLISGDTVGILQGYAAGAGYDLATGLGSLNVANVVTAWPVTSGTATAKVTVTPAQASLLSTSALTVTGTVAAGSSGGTAPTGTVTLSGGGYSSAAQSLTAGAYTVSIPADSLIAGSAVTLTVSYSGDTNYAPASGTASVAVTVPSGTATVTVTPSASSAIANTALSVSVTVTSVASGGTAPTGTVTISGGGYFASAAKTLSAGASTFAIPANDLLVGTDTLTVSYSGDANYAASSGTAVVTVTPPPTPTVTVTPASTTVVASNSLSVAVTVAAATSGGATPTGTVTLSGGGYTSPAATLVSGAYPFTIPANSLTAGSDVLTVSYSGDTNYSAASGTATVTVTSSTSSTGTFTLSATAPASVTAGTSATSTITVTASNSYAGTASLTCALTSSPSGAVDQPTCSLSPTTVTLSSTSASGTVTASVATTAATTSQLVRPEPHGKGREWLGGGAVLAFLIFFGIPARRRSWRSMLSAFLVMAVLAGLSGCGDFWQAPGGNTADGTTTGNYTFTVTGTGAPAVASAVTTTFVVTVN
jgi:hypothetical protein